VLKERRGKEGGGRKRANTSGGLRRAVYFFSGRAGLLGAGQKKGRGSQGGVGEKGEKEGGENWQQNES